MNSGIRKTICGRVGLHSDKNEELSLIKWLTSWFLMDNMPDV